MSGNTYDFNLAAAVGANQLVQVSGTQCLITGLSTYQVEITTDTGEKFKCYEGQGFECAPGGSFSWLMIRNLQAVALAGSIFVGDAGWLDRRLFGSVKVIDQSVEKSSNGNQFFGSVQISAWAGGNCCVLTALGGGGKRVAVRKLAIMSTVAGATLLLSSTGVGSLGAPSGLLPSKIINGTASGSARAQAFNIAGASPTAGEVPGGIGIVRIYIPANTFYTLALDTPIILSGNNQLVVNAEALNRDLIVYYDIEEVV